ncbi:MAG: prolipoprotein diacylglyceryl transferase [Candidatus Omnitrophota bacterium]
MKPILFQCGFLTIYTYGVSVAVAFFVASFLAGREARRRGLDENRIYNLTIFLLVSGIVGARLFYVGLNWDYFKTDLLEVFKLQHGGLVWFGGLVGATFAGWIFLKIKRMDVLATLDLMAPYIALAQAIGRIGCFFNGCCYGKPSAWGIYFPVHETALFPSQLLDSFTLLVIFVVLRLFSASRNKGVVLSLYLVLASLQRFLMEFLRADTRPFYGPLSIFQWISIGLFVLGLAGTICWTWKRKDSS